MQLVPHGRTLRKAREQVKLMVIDGVSPLRISSYLNRWAMWWVDDIKKLALSRGHGVVFEGLLG